MSTGTGNFGINMMFVVILLMVIAVILVIMMMVTTNEMKRLQKQYNQFMSGMDGKSLEKKFRQRFALLDKLSDIQDQQENEMKILHVLQDRSLMKYGIVKYDAFEDVGGKMSFALALLDRNNTGFVLNAVHSKDDCFLYLKEIVNGESFIMLSKEEVQALQAAEQFGEEEDVITGFSSPDRRKQDRTGRR